MYSKKKYEPVAYKTLHLYVLAYQKDKKYAGKIIEAFNGFILKFVKLICFNEYDYNDKNIRHFLSLYTSKNNEKYLSLNKYKYSKKSKNKFDDIAINVHQYFLSYSSEEIRNELIIALLKMALKYSDYKKPSFHNYVDKCFHYYAYNQLKKLITDPISRQSCLLDYDETYIQNISTIDYNQPKQLADRINTIEAIEQISYENDDYLLAETNANNSIAIRNKVHTEQNITSQYDNSYFNFNWLYGFTCNDIFKCLTIFERELLISYYINHKTGDEIARQYGLCRATISKKLNIAKKKLLKSLQLKSGEK